MSTMVTITLSTCFDAKSHKTALNSSCYICFDP